MNRKRLTKLIDICKYKWNIPVIALLEEKEVAGFNMIANELKVSKDSLNSTLKTLIQKELLEKRKDIAATQNVYYYLTPQGKRISENCLYFYRQASKLKMTHLLSYKWTLPIVVSLIESKLKFSELKSLFPGITSRGLSTTLKKLAANKVVKKEILNTFPLTITYSLTNKGESLYKTVNNFYLILS